ALEQALSFERVELEVERPDGLLLEVDGQLAAGAHELLHLLLGQDDGQEAGLDRVRTEDVAERRRHDRLETPFLEGPRGMLARGPAAEVPPGEEDLGALRLRPVE